MTSPATPSPSDTPAGQAGTPDGQAGTTDGQAGTTDGQAAGTAGTAPPVATDAEELARLRGEVAVLRGRLDTRQRRRNGMLMFRRVTAAILVVLAAICLVAGVVGVWGARTVLNTDRWVATVAPLPSNPQVSTAVSQYATTQLFEVVDVEQRLRQVLPPQAAFVAGPVAGQVRDFVQRTVTDVLRSEQFQPIWIELNRRAHQRALAIINGTSTVVQAQSDHVDVDLLPLINQVLRQISAQLPTLFGKQITLPDLSSGEIPADLRVRVEDALGVTLPANFAQFTIYDQGQLQAVQDTVARAKRGLVLFVVATFVLLILAYVVSPWRRRTTVQLGIALVLAAVAITVILRAVRDQLLQQVPEGVYRDATAAAMTSVFAPLRDRGTQVLWIGVVLAVVAYLAGPGRLAVWLRRQAARGLSAAGRWIGRGGTAAAAHGPGFVARYRDPLRIAGLVVAVVCALIWSSWTSLLIIVAVLIAYEVAVTLIGRRGTEPGPEPEAEPLPEPRPEAVPEDQAAPSTDGRAVPASGSGMSPG